MYMFIIKEIMNINLRAYVAPTNSDRHRTTIFAFILNSRKKREENNILVRIKQSEHPRLLIISEDSQERPKVVIENKT
jgi:hypothetical protein